MYYVVRTGVPLTLEQAMVAAGAAAVECIERLGADDDWRERPRKVALRANDEEFEQVTAEEPCAVCGDWLLCLPPRRKSERSPLLEALQPFTDAPRPKEEKRTEGSPRMLYAMRPGVMRTAGKAMAQAGHAAQMSVEEYGEEFKERFDAWREAGRPGELATVDDDEWERLKADPEAVTVSDAGHTQVAPGTETVIALVPAPRPPAPQQ
jgi:PTH2 family peptidyl-tRNA hydrolase